MKISILVPIYGVERYIARCAESLFSQTYEDLEYIFVDDRTPDHSIEILKDVLQQFPERQSQVTILRHDVNKGLGAARLTALKAATGNYLMHVDSDDELPLQAVELLATKAQQSGADIIDGGYSMIRQGQLTESHRPFIGSKTAFLKLLLCQNIVLSMVWARLYKRDVYSRYQILPVPGIDYAEDWAIVPRLYLHASRDTVNSVVYHYRDDSAESFTNVVMSDKAKRSLLKANALVNEYYREYDKENKYRYALELGYISTLRVARNNDIDMTLVNQTLNVSCQHLATRLMANIMRSNCPMPVASILYRCLRKVYEVKVRLFS